MEEELVKRLDKFYGFIAPDGEKIPVEENKDDSKITKN